MRIDVHPSAVDGRLYPGISQVSVRTDNCVRGVMFHSPMDRLRGVCRSITTHYTLHTAYPLIVQSAGLKACAMGRVDPFLARLSEFPLDRGCAVVRARVYYAVS